MKELLSRNRSTVLGRLERAATRAGRRPGDVRLVAVTKTVDVDTAAALCELGQRDLAENRLPGLEEKARAFAERSLDVRWHWVGHLQRNKARKVARLAHVLHSLDSLQLVDTLARVCAEEDLERQVFLQVKLSGEREKHGLAEEEVPEALERASRASPLTVRGLMTMAPWLDAEGARLDAARAVFRRLREIAGSLDAAAFASGAPELSMGMSGDCEVAVDEGAHWVRVGNALFEGIRRRAGRGTA